MGGKKISGSGSKLNCAVGSDDLGSRPGSGFNLKPVQTSTVCTHSTLFTHIYIYIHNNEGATDYS